MEWNGQGDWMPAEIRTAALLAQLRVRRPPLTRSIAREHLSAAGVPLVAVDAAQLRDVATAAAV